MMRFSFILFFLFPFQLLFAQSKDTLTTKTGLKYFLTHQGNSQAIDSGMVVIQHYTLWLSNGDKLDSSRDRDQPFVIEYPSERVIAGTNEAMSLMKVGDRGIFIMPYHLAYGEKGVGPIAPKETLTFDIEILDTKKSSVHKILTNVLYDESFQTDSIPKIKKALDKYQQLKEDGFKDLYSSEGDLNQIGYGLIKKFPKDALAIFKQNVIEYPASSNVYDSLGEVYMILGENELAVLNYKKSIELNPDNTNALKMLEKLKDQ